MKTVKRIICICLAASLLSVLIPINEIFADGNEIRIKNEDDLIEFAKNCTLDSFSYGKTVFLDADIKLEGGKFECIPIFCGIFEGGGHKIENFSMEKSGSNTGFFRYITKGAAVKNLSISGKCTPKGSKINVGGFSARNSGRIEYCSFSGEVKGAEGAGAIAAVNEYTGEIAFCSSDADVYAEKCSGGIAGENYGYITQCESHSRVNTAYEKKSVSIDTMETDPGSIIDSYRLGKDIEEKNGFLSNSDIGGIAGYSNGIIEGCVNCGTVGYSHIGYNVGGIAGRQSGYIVGCRNEALVRGRKDVGGIAGQAEPFILLDSKGNNISRIRDEMNLLHTMVQGFIADTDKTRGNAGTYLKMLSENADTALECTERLSDGMKGFADDNIASANSAAALVSNYLSRLDGTLDGLISATDEISDSLVLINKFIDEISTPENKQNLQKAASDLSGAASDIKGGLRKIDKAISSLKSAIGIKDYFTAKKAADELFKAVNDVKSNLDTMRNGVNTIINIIKESGISGTWEKRDAVLQALGDIHNSLTAIISKFPSIITSVNTIRNSSNFDLEELKNAAKYAEDAYYYISDALYGTANALSSMAAVLSTDIDDSDLTEAINKLKYAVDDAKSSLVLINDIVSDLSKEEPIKFIPLDKDVQDSGRELLDAASAMNDTLKNLRISMSADMDKINSDMVGISNQFKHVMDMIIDDVEELSDKKESDIFVDISDERIESTKQGKIDGCSNNAKIEADRNVGGIVGALAIEYAKDPEDELEKPSGLNFTYLTKAIVMDCINDGKVTAKKDCVGGIAGLCDLGTVYRCENYSHIESSDGSYAGAIAGKSDSTVRKCYAKGTARATGYVGGVCGMGRNVSGCYAITKTVGEESVGAILGAAADKAVTAENYFIDNGIGGIDKISYSGKAEPVDYDTLSKIPGIPERFSGFKVTFVADDETVSEKDVRYGQETDSIKKPDIPEKEGYFGKWKPFEEERVYSDITVECEYCEYITFLASEEKKDGGVLSLCLAEGNYTDEAVLHAAKSDENPPEKVISQYDVYDISIENSDISDTDEVTLRLLNEDLTGARVWVKSGDEWIEKDTSSRGKYIVFTAEGSKNTVCIRYGSVSYWLIYSIGAALIAAAAVIIIILIRKKRKAPRTKSDKKEEMSVL